MLQYLQTRRKEEDVYLFAVSFANIFWKLPLSLLFDIVITILQDY